jgi:hypothetical protein
MNNYSINTHNANKPPELVIDIALKKPESRDYYSGPNYCPVNNFTHRTSVFIVQYKLIRLKM